MGPARCAEEQDLKPIPSGLRINDIAYTEGGVIR
jgi:hypothetical protein